MAQLKIEIPRIPKAADVSFLFSSLAKSNEPLIRDPALLQPQSSFYAFLRDEANDVCGGAFLQESFDIVYVNSFWISERYRGQGHGSRLYRAIEYIAYIKKKRRAVLCVFGFQNAVPFWEKLGFSRFGEVPDENSANRLIYLSKTIKSEVR
jgi:GNAT superfamily N-acetyltransferase